MKKVKLFLENGEKRVFDNVYSVNYPDNTSEFYFIHQRPTPLTKNTFHIHYSKVYSLFMEEE